MSTNTKDDSVHESRIDDTARRHGSICRHRLPLCSTTGLDRFRLQPRAPRPLKVRPATIAARQAMRQIHAASTAA